VRMISVVCSLLRRSIGGAAVLWVASMPLDALPAPGDRIGSDFLVNSYTTGEQTQWVASIGGNFVARDDNGNFVVVWASIHDGSTRGVFGQRFDSTGASAGTEFQINSYTTNMQYLQQVAMAPDGRFVVVWMSNQQDADNGGIFGQRFDAAGAAAGGEFQINTARSATSVFPRLRWMRRAASW